MTKTKTKTKKKGGSQADGTRRSYFMYRPDELVIVGLDTKDGPEHPSYDARIEVPLSWPKLVALKNSIKRYGVREAIKFKRDGDRNIVTEGRQRIRCARQATIELIAEGRMKPGDTIMIPSVAWKGSHEDLYVMARSMNASRLENDAIANAKEASIMLGWGKSHAEVAEAMGVTKQTISDWIVLLGATPAVQRAVRGGMAASAAAKIAKLPSGQQVATLAAVAREGARPTARDVENKLRADQGKPAVETPAQRLRKIEAIIAAAGGAPTIAECVDALCKIAHSAFGIVLAPMPDLRTIAKLGKEVAARVVAARPPLGNEDSTGETCQCGHAVEEHGNDPEHPGSTSCEECPEGDCIAYEAA